MTESRTATAADWATELPHEPPRNEPTWCENYCFDLHDGMLGISLWLHLSRSQLHPTLWREVINVILPDGRIGMWKGYGRGPVVRPRPEGPTLSVDVIEPFERLQLSCIGVVQLTDEEELITGPLGDDIEVPFLLDLEWRSATEVWDLRDHMADQVWATGHYEQGGRVTGTLAVDGQEWAFNGTGWRDHSLGPRNNAGMQDHDWAHAVFPSGNAFAVFRHSQVGVGQDLGGAFVSEAGEGRQVRFLSIDPPAVWPPRKGPQMVEIVLDTGEKQETVTAELLRTAWSGSAPPAHQSFGRRTTTGHLRWESQTKFTWRGGGGARNIRADTEAPGRRPELTTLRADGAAPAAPSTLSS